MAKKETKYRLKKTGVINGVQFKAGLVKTEKEWAKICQFALPYFRENYKKRFVKISLDEPLKISEMEIQKVEEAIKIMSKLLKYMKTYGGDAPKVKTSKSVKSKK